MIGAMMSNETRKALRRWQAYQATHLSSMRRMNAAAREASETMLAFGKAFAKR
jgi:hypothetical protein